MLLCPPNQYPTHVGPPAAVTRTVWISFLVREAMVDAMGNHPVGRTTFHSQGPAQGQEILHRLGRLIATMRQEPVVAHADAQTACDPVKDHCHNQCPPAETE